MKKKYSIAIIIAMILMGLAACDEINEIINEPVDSYVNDIVGRGYDVTDRYAVSEDIKGSILNVQLLADEKRLIEDKNVAKADFFTLSGQSISEYQSNFSLKASLSGGYKGFQGEVSGNFMKEISRNENRSYATVQSNIKKTAWYVKERRDVENLKEYLDPSFEERINDSTYSTADLFSIYGTHCLLGAVYGARLDYNVSAVRTTENSSKSIAAYASLSFKNLFSSAKISVDTNKDYSSSFDESTKSVSTKVVGGSPELGQSIQSDGDYQKWIESVDKNPVLMDFYEDGLLPIWEFCKDDTRAQAIKQEFIKYIEGKVAFGETGTKVTFSVYDFNIENTNIDQEYEAFCFSLLLDDKEKITNLSKLDPNNEAYKKLINEANRWSEIKVANNSDDCWIIDNEDTKGNTLEGFKTPSPYIILEELEDETVYFRIQTDLGIGDNSDGIYLYENEFEEEKLIITKDIIEIKGSQLKKGERLTYTVTGNTKDVDDKARNISTITYEVTFN